jgi:hypothetical protein
VIYDLTANSNPNSESDRRSLVESVFHDPENVGQGEYTVIYEFLLNPDIRDDPDAITGVLEEFAGWANYMLEQMQKATTLLGK